jgi:hypothetical protein
VDSTWDSISQRQLTMEPKIGSINLANLEVANVHRKSEFPLKALNN